MLSHISRFISQKILLLGASLISAAILCEILLRVLALQGFVTFPAHRYRNEWTPGKFSSEDVFKVRKERWFYFRTRHANNPRAKYPRIVVLGDSFTWGDKIFSTRELWPSLLEQKLANSGHDVEVVNLAYKGLNSVGEAAVLEQIGWSYKPDIVLLQYLINDPVPSISPFFAERMSGASANVIPLAIWKPLHDILDHHCYLYSFANKVWGQLLGRFNGNEEYSYAQLHTAGYPGWENAQNALRDINRKCAERRVKFMMILFPILPRTNRLDDKYMYIELDRKLADFSIANKIEFFNLRPEIAARDSKAGHWRARKDDGHPSPQFHDAAADIIAGKLRELKWINASNRSTIK